MTGLLKTILFLGFVAAVAYGVFFIDFGGLTLHGHLRKISQTPEAVALSAEIEKKATETREEVLNRVPERPEPKTRQGKAAEPGKTSPAQASPPKGRVKTSDPKKADIPEKDRAALVQLLREKSK